MSKAENLLNKIKQQVLKKQKNKLRGMKGKYVERDGKLFLIVDIDYKNNKIIVSDTKTIIHNVVNFSINSFLSKAISEVK